MKISMLIAAIVVAATCGCDSQSGRVDEIVQPTRAPSVKPAAAAPTHVVDERLRSILDQIISIVLTAERLEESREFYGTKADDRCALVDNNVCGVPWPTWYTPKCDGITFIRAVEGTPVGPENRRLLGIRIDKLDLDAKDTSNAGLYDGPIQVTLLNEGGDPEGVMVIGGAGLHFELRQQNGKPKVVLGSMLDP